MTIYDPKVFGASLFRLQPDRPLKRAREPHTLAQRWQAPSRDQFSLGAAPDGWPNMRIIGIEPDEEVENNAYDIKLDCEGILGEESWLELDCVDDSPEEGWDVRNLTVYTREPDVVRWRKGSQILDPDNPAVVAAGMGMLWITDRRKRAARAKGYYELDLQLKGLFQGEGDLKLVKRRIASSAQAASCTADGTAYFSTYSGNPPTFAGLTTFSVENANVEFDLPQVSVTDTFISTSPPPTLLVPGFWTPPNAPDVFVFPLALSSATYHCPYGWKVLNLQSEQIPGKSLWLISITWGYQRADTPS